MTDSGTPPNGDVVAGAVEGTSERPPTNQTDGSATDQTGGPSTMHGDSAAGSVSSDEPPIVECTAISHEYDPRSTGGPIRRRLQKSASKPVTALRDVSLTIQHDEVVGMVGPSGSGKSTLLHAIGGLLVPSEGTVSFEGRPVSDRSARERARYRRDHVGFVFQRFHLLPSLSARANVAVPLVTAGLSRKERRRRSTELLDSVGLGDRADHRPGELSGGERQRVAIARALVTDPDLVLADEPTGELDTETGRRVLDVLTEAAANRTIVIATHDEAALSVTDRTITLSDGEVIRS